MEQPINKLFSAHRANCWDEFIYVRWLAVDDRAAPAKAGTNLIHQGIVGRVIAHERYRPQNWNGGNRGDSSQCENRFLGATADQAMGAANARFRP